MKKIFDGKGNAMTRERRDKDDRGWNLGRTGDAYTQHEYGHYLQYRRFGYRSYWGNIAPKSLIDLGLHKMGMLSGTHQEMYLEMDATTRANNYFGNKSLFNGSDLQEWFPYNH